MHCDAGGKQVNASNNKITDDFVYIKGDLEYVHYCYLSYNIANCRIKHSICKIKVLYCYSFILRIKIWWRWFFFFWPRGGCGWWGCGRCSQVIGIFIPCSYILTDWPRMLFISFFRLSYLKYLYSCLSNNQICVLCKSTRRAHCWNLKKKGYSIWLHEKENLFL